jgi:hypothetical protein
LFLFCIACSLPAIQKQTGDGVHYMLKNSVCRLGKMAAVAGINNNEQSLGTKAQPDKDFDAAIGRSGSATT